VRPSIVPAAVQYETLVQAQYCVIDLVLPQAYIIPYMLSSSPSHSVLRLVENVYEVLD
jgi:hypothetical protein